MKINSKFFVIAFILVIFSIGAVAASEDMSLQSSDLDSVSSETLSLSSTQEIETTNGASLDANQVNSDIKINDTINVKNSNSLLGASNNEILGITPSGTTFQDIIDAISQSNPGEIIDLAGKTYTGTGSQIFIDKDITIMGSSDGSSAILDPNQLSRVFDIQNGCKVTISNVIFENLQSGINGPAIFHHGNGDLLVDNSTVRNTILNYPNTLDGGAITAEAYSNVVLNNYKYYNNTVYANRLDGAALRVYHHSTIIINGFEDYDNNISANNLYGGLIFTGTDSNTYLYDVIHRNNYIYAVNGLYGGLINTYSSNRNITLTMDGIVDYQNHVISKGAMRGGTVNVEDPSSKELNIFNFNSTENIIEAVDHISGGLIRSAYTDTFNFINITVVNNSAFWNYRTGVDPFDHQAGFSPGFILIGSQGIIKGAHFEDNFYNAALGIAMQILPNSLVSPIIVEDSVFINTTGHSAYLDSNRTSDIEHGGAICVNEDQNGAAIIRNCLFENNLNCQGGAITPHNHCLIENCRFINNTATKYYGGAISTNYGLVHKNANITIKDCYFEGNSAPIGGAIQARGEHIEILNSTFINNSAIKGGAIFVEGNTTNIIDCNFSGNNATHNLGPNVLNTPSHLVDYDVISDYNANGGAIYLDGSYAFLNNNRFFDNSAIHIFDGVEEGKGGALFIYGDHNQLLNSYFDDNFAHSGNGSAVYVLGLNGTIYNSEFYNHDSERGTVYVLGNNFTLLDSKFEHNAASLDGAGLYMEGDYSYVNNTIFKDNNASVHGGAIHSYGDHIQILNSEFISNHAIPNLTNIDQGLGGAIYIRGNNNSISYSYFNLNTARNGSAVYNRGINLSFVDDMFEENQAWSYLLPTTADPELSYYSENNTVKVEVIHIAGDNIINAIHNDGAPENVFFYNVTYEHSTGTKTTTPEEIHPRDGVENSENGKWLYQDPREDLQIVMVDIIHDETGNVVYRNYDPNLLGYSIYGATGPTTGLYGNITVYLVGLNPGNYTVKAIHPEDSLYKEISNSTSFEILPIADLAIVKEVSNKTPDLGDIVSWTLKVTNNGPNDASGVYVKDELPAGLIYVDCDGDYNPDTHIWTIGDLAVNDTVILKIRTIVNITNTTILNIANVNSSTYDPNETNNVANNTTKANPIADLSVIKLVSNKTTVNGDTITWTIIVKNNGPDVAVNAKAYDVLPKDLIFLESDGNYNPNTHIWTIGDLAFNQTAILKIKTKVNTTNKTIVNNVYVNSSTPDSNESNNNASNDTEVLYPNLTVSKITLDKLVLVGNQVRFEIVVRNTGEIALNDVFVKELSYDGLTYASFEDNGLWTYDGQGVWKLNKVLNINEVVNLVVKFNTTNVGNFTNIVVSGSNETENKTTNNTTKVIEPKLDVQKITITPVVLVGEQVTFEIIVKNIGDATLTDVFVEESSYDGLTYDSYVDNGLWTHSVVNGKNRWTLNTNLTVKEVMGLFVVFNTTEKGNFTNVVVAGSNETENKTTNNTTKVVEPKLDVRKITITPTVLVGEQTTFEIVVRNTGQTALNDVFVKELSYEGLVYDSFVDTGLWSYDGKGVWTLNKVLEINEVVSLFVTFNTTHKGNFTNVVVAGSNETENKTTNNTTTVYKPEIDVQKITITPVVLVSEQTTFEIIVKNTGDVDLTNVSVKELSYDGLTYDSFDDTGLWSYDGKGVWTLNKVLAVNEVETLIIYFNTTEVGNFTNVVVAGSDETENKTTNNTTTVIEGKLDVRKITITPVVLVGDQVTFEIVVKNIGDATLTGVFVEESSYDGLTYDSYVDNGLWTYSVVNGMNRWTLNTNLAINEVVGLFVVFNTTEKGNFTNVVVVGSDETENKTTNNTTKVVEAKLDVQKITLTPVVPVGNQTSFEIVVRNTGEVALHNVVLEETSYEGLTYDSYVKNNDWTHSVANGKNIWTLNKVLEVHEVVTLIVYFNTTEVGNFTNIVTVGSNESENKIANNTTNVYNKTNPDPESNKTKNPNINIEKIALNNLVMVGEQVIFEIIVKNTGDVILHDVIVTEDSFEGLKYVTFFDNTRLWINDNLTWTLNTSLYVGEVASFYVVFNTTSPGEFTNIVSVDSNETDKKSANDTVEVVKPELEVQKVAINKTVLVGDKVMFEIIVQNTGKVTLNNVVVSENSYDGLVYDSFIDYTKLWTKNNDLSWKLNTPLYVGEYAGFFVIFNTTTTGKFVNVVVAGSDETPNKTDNDTVDVLKANVDVQKITITPVVPVGNQTSFEIIVRNTGEVALHNIVLEETSYEGLTYASYIPNKDWTHSFVNGKNIWTLNKVLNVHEVVTLIVNFNTTQIGNFTNIVTVGSNETENKIANNTTNVYNRTTPDPESNKTKNPNINIEKIALQNVVIVGSQAVFEIIVSNTGNVVLHDVTVTEDSFNGLVYDRWFDNTGLWNNSRYLTWTMNSPLYVGEFATFYAVFNTTTPGEFMNIVSVDSNETDKKSANDTVEVIKPDMEVQKITINKSVMVGEQVMFEIVVHNSGQVALNNVVVSESSYDGLVYDSFVDSTGLWTKNNGLSWNLNAPLYVGEYAGFFIVFNTTSEGNFVNVVVVDSKEVPNKTSNDTVEVLKPSLDVQKITINRTVYVGEKVMFEIIVQNTGNMVLNGVTVHENSYDGLIYDSFIDYNNIWTKNSDLSWTLNAPLSVGEYAEFFVVFSTNKVGNFTNVVLASSDKTQNKSANNTTNVVDRPTPKTPMADLAITKVVYSIDGDKVTWGLYVVNYGPDKAVNARVTDVLPKTLQYINSIASKGLYDASTGVWTIGDMENGEEAVMIIESLALTTGEITNEANVTSDTYDPNMSNNYDNETVVISVETPQKPANVEPVDVTPATGNPLVMVLLALFVLAVGTLRRKK